MNRQQLLDSIKPGMSLNEEFFKRIYGYELTWPGFAEIALQKLEKAGSTRSREHYERFSQKYEKESKEISRRVGEWYVEQLEKKRNKKKEGGDLKRKQMKDCLQTLNDKELLMIYQMRKSENRTS